MAAQVRESLPSFSVDLVTGARAHVAFLKEVHAHGLSLSRPSSESLRRYETLWLPLVAASTDSSTGPLIPPLDIAWVWHCHRLAPDAYERVCLARFDRLLDQADAAFQAQTEHGGTPPDGSESTRRLWADMYPEEPFFLPDGPTDSTTTHEGIIEGFDVAGSAERQATFLWQVSGPRFSDESFLRDGVINYGRFLTLMRLHPGAFLVPTYQLDLIWHTHILASTKAYQADCTAITGFKHAPDHDDSVNDRSSPETKLNVSTTSTRKLWLEAFGMPFGVEGGMYRGEPPSEYWSPSWVSGA